MSTYMPILYALQSGKLKQEDFVDYMPEKMRHVYLMHGRNEYTTEFDLGWHAVIYKGFGVLLVSDQPTKARIRYTENGIEYDELKKYATLYENNQFNSMSVALTTELYNMIPENLRKHDILVYSEKLKFRRYYNIRRNDAGVFGGRNRDFHMYIYMKNMLPTIFIPPDTIVEIEDGDEAGTTKEKSFKLFPRLSKENSVSKTSLDEFKVPMWISLAEAMETRAISPDSFVEYVSNKKNKFYIEEIYSYNDTLENTEGWHPQLISEKDDQYVQIVSRDCESFSSDVYPDIINGIIEFKGFEEDNPIPLLKVYAKLNLKKIKMFLKLPNKVMIQVNHPEYDGSSLGKAYKLKI